MLMDKVLIMITEEKVRHNIQGQTLDQERLRQNMTRENMIREQQFRIQSQESRIQELQARIQSQEGRSQLQEVKIQEQEATISELLEELHRKTAHPGSRGSGVSKVKSVIQYKGPSSSNQPPTNHQVDKVGSQPIFW